jgi:hypothetical protein
MAPHSAGLELPPTLLFHQSDPSLHTTSPFAHSRAMPCLARRTRAKRLWVAHSLRKHLLDSAFLDTEVLRRTYSALFSPAHLTVAPARVRP